MYFLKWTQQDDCCPGVVHHLRGQGHQGVILCHVRILFGWYEYEDGVRGWYSEGFVMMVSRQCLDGVSMVWWWYQHSLVMVSRQCLDGVSMVWWWCHHGMMMVSAQFDDGVKMAKKPLITLAWRLHHDLSNDVFDQGIVTMKEHRRPRCRCYWV